MDLSEYERRVLGEIEDGLSADNPHLAAAMRRARAYRRTRRIVLHAAGLLAGAALLLLGVRVNSDAGVGLALMGYGLVVATLNALLPAPFTWPRSLRRRK
jgi:hypothetical protein